MVERTMENNFSMLEEKVLRAVHLIQDLRAENAQLQKQNEEWKSRFEALKEDNERISRELDEGHEVLSRQRFRVADTSTNALPAPG